MSDTTKRPLPTLSEIDAALANFGRAVDENKITLATIHAAVCTDFLERLRDGIRAGDVLILPQALAAGDICWCRKNPCVCESSHDTECESELTSHGRTPCRCAERAALLADEADAPPKRRGPAER